MLAGCRPGCPVRRADCPPGRASASAGTGVYPGPSAQKFRHTLLKIGLTNLPIDRHPLPRAVPIQSLTPRRLYRQIADQLRTLIHAGEFAVGARLPPERDLAAQLGVSRPSVREALIALEVEGLVEVRMGSGIYVLAREAAASAPRVDTAYGPFEIIRARLVVECELAALAARQMDATQHQALRDALALIPLANDALRDKGCRW